MASTSSSDVKFPIRRAPPIPKSNDKQAKTNSLQELLTLGADPFNANSSRSRNDSFCRDKKKPPPRPPPPRTSNSSRQVLGSFLSKDSKRGKIAATAVVKPLPAAPVATGTLIDLNSPESSPTFTKLSCDLSSISSGSSINNTNCLLESGFEDDFNPFGSSNRTTPGSDWSDCYDPFSPPKKAALVLKSQQDSVTVTKKPFVMPTIIRPVKSVKPGRPPPPGSQPKQDPWGRDSSPPMPSAPAPPPPPEAINILLNGPPVPPRPNSNSESKSPYCVAEYDFESTHPDDLPFKVGDVIALVEKLNDEWLSGRAHGVEGMFPANYVRVVVPLDGETPGQPLSAVFKAIALFPFQAETWDDLDFNEGDEIKVISRINENWLYGECNGKKGQFPENFVQDISDFVSDSP